MAFIDTIEKDLRTKLGDRRVVQVSFGAGPSCVAGKVERFDTPVTFGEALAWLDQYAHVLTRGHLSFEDGSGLWVERSGSCRYVEKSPPQEPGVVVTHPKEDV